MQNVYKKFRIWGLLLFLIVFVAAAATHMSTTEVQAANKTGFQTINGKTYYIDPDGSKHKGWLELKGVKYYFDSKTGVQCKGWLKDSKGNKRYFTSKAGAMVTGWLENSKGQKRYFDPKTGIMKTKWMTLNDKKYYFYSNSGVAATGFLKDSKDNTRYFYSEACYMATGWLKNSKGEKRYFEKKDGVMATGFNEIDDNTYYFYSGNGKMATGWVENKDKGIKYYFDPDTGIMYTGKHTIDGKEYVFAENGVYTPDVPTVPSDKPTGSKTIKNYLLGAVQPVGQALYVWGGGWTDSTRKGVSPIWKQWYASQSSSYDYNNYKDLSTSTRQKGLDCSGFVGWAAYQVMHTKSGVGYGYTVVANDVGSYYKSKGWGSILTQANLASSNYTLKPGDVGYNSGHTWIVIGQCKDKSAVIVHSTPNAGCQISGTPTPSGAYGSQAIALAKKYMSRYAGYSKYGYHTSSGNYIRNGNYLRWNRSTLSDPDGYLNMTADQILADIFD